MYSYAKTLNNGFNLENMMRDHSGLQSKMGDKQIKMEDGYLAPLKRQTRRARKKRYGSDVEG